MQSPVNFTLYKKSFQRLQAFVFAVPVISAIFTRHSGVPFPPMGDDCTTWRFYALAIIGTSGLLPYFLLPSKYRKAVIGGLFAVFIALTASYLVLESRYVVPIRYPDGSASYVTRGTARSPELQEPYRSMKDDDLIRSTGQSDSRLEHAYTPESLHSNRQTLFWTYVSSLVFFELFLGSAVKAG